jgi:4-diphosphocytidyl-2-C-methyl-D-erythritol kinase
LTPLHLPSAWYLIVDPGVTVPTRELFAAPELTRDTPKLTIRALPPDGGRNDFEPVVRKRYPRISEVLDRLAAHGGRLTGTGACVFARFASQAEAQKIAVDFATGFRTWVVRGLDS